TLADHRLRPLLVFFDVVFDLRAAMARLIGKTFCSALSAALNIFSSHRLLYRRPAKISISRISSTNPNPPDGP
ncbi:MAG TPA: hypothetical protein VGI89_05890, partial [Rhizomicrobium sp.]